MSSSTQAFVLYKKDKNPSKVKILLDIPFKKAMVYWTQYLKSIRMEDCYEFYKEDSYDIPRILSINTFMKRNNNVSGEDIVNVLRTVNDVINLNQTHSNLKAEIEILQKIKNHYSLTQHTNYKPLLPLGLAEHYYHY